MTASGPVAIVTGASSGIGAATALRLARDGFIVYAAARRVDRMRQLEAAGIRIVSLDVTDDPAVTALVARVLSDQGRVDVLVNNAGYGAYGAFEEVPPEEARRQFDVNVFALARLTQLVLPSMRERRSGTIVNISSIGGRITTPLGSWYHASKFAVEGLSDALRIEVAPFGVRVVVIEPGAIETEWGGIARASAVETSGSGPYRPLVESATAFLEAADRPGRASPPSVVADAISRAVASKRPHARYAVGSQARFALGARRLLPDRVFDRVISRLFLGRMRRPR